MAQLRQDYQKFTDLGAEIVNLGPDGPKAFQRYWEENEIPFIGLADIKSKVADEYYQEVNLLKLGRMPAIFIIDQDGMIRYTHYADSMSDIPDNSEILEEIKRIQAE